MARRDFAVLVVPAACALVFACADIVGISDLPAPVDGGSEWVPYDGGPPPDNNICTSSKTVLTTDKVPDYVVASNGFVYAGGDYDGVFRCDVTGVCNSPGSLVTVPVNYTFKSWAVGSLLYYTVQGQAGANQGSVHSIGLGGSNDQVLLSNQAYPSWVALSGSRTFWTNDFITGSNYNDLTPSVVHCIGCNGNDTPWITNLNATYGLEADANDVYVLAGDGSANGTYGIFGCGVTSACNGTPRPVAVGLSPFTSRAMFGSDGTNVYVSRDQASDIVRIDPSGSSKTIVSSVSVDALTVDASSGFVYFATSDGLIGQLKSDGSAPPVLLATCDTVNGGTMQAIASDATNVYVLVYLWDGGVGLYSIQHV
jgi:hypothetical protein